MRRIAGICLSLKRSDKWILTVSDRYVMVYIPLTQGSKNTIIWTQFTKFSTGLAPVHQLFFEALDQVSNMVWPWSEIYSFNLKIFMEMHAVHQTIFRSINFFNCWTKCLVTKKTFLCLVRTTGTIYSRTYLPRLTTKTIVSSNKLPYVIPMTIFLKLNPWTLVHQTNKPYQLPTTFFSLICSDLESLAQYSLNCKQSFNLLDLLPVNQF